MARGQQKIQSQQKAAEKQGANVRRMRRVVCCLLMRRAFGCTCALLFAVHVSRTMRSTFDVRSVALSLCTKCYLRMRRTMFYVMRNIARAYFNYFKCGIRRTVPCMCCSKCYPHTRNMWCHASVL